MTPRPGAFALLRTKTVKIHATSRLEGLAGEAAPGTVVLADKSRVIVACGPKGEERIVVTRVQMEGKRVVSAGEWVAGRGVAEGDVLSAS